MFCACVCVGVWRRSDRIVGVDVKKRRLQNGGGKDDFVHLWVVVSVDCLGQHEPPARVEEVEEAQPTPSYFF